ncbi:MAG: ABC transporter permease [Vicinamibacteria bacterium]|nr:ABC transporter permease [Vicinamibacteria bacterium]
MTTNRDPNPPRLAVRLVRLTAPLSDRDCMLGDLEEEFARRQATGDLKAHWWFWQQALRSTPPNLGRRRLEASAWQRANPTHRKGDDAMTSFLYDLRFAWRSVTRNKRLAATIVGTLALGMATTTVIFSVIDGVILNPFPFPDPDRLVGVGTALPKIQQDVTFIENMSPAEYVDIKGASTTMTGSVAWDMGNRQVSEGGSTENLFSAFWWGDALPTLGVQAAAGRGFLDEEIKAGKKVAIVSHRFWTNRMGADAERIGGPLVVNGEVYTLVGVLPRRVLVYGTDLWLTMPVSPGVYPRGRRQFQLLARLTSGKTMEDANTELAVIAARTDTQFRSAQPEYEMWRMEARSFVDINVGLMRPAAAILFFAALFVLLIACVNVASLLLARAMRRSREMAMRVTLGARRGQILRQLVCESTLHALLGALVGTALATQGVGALQFALSKITAPVPGEIALSMRVLAATLLVTLVSGFLFGLAPALYTLRSNTQAALRAEGPTATGGSQRLRAHRFFIGVQMAFAALLVACSGLLVRSLVRLQSVDPGVASTQLLGFRTTLASERYRSVAEYQRFFETLQANLASLPGVTSATVATQTPPNYFSTNSFVIEGEEVAAEGGLRNAYFTAVTPNYFATMGIPLREGRLLSADDRAGTPPAVLINEAAARSFFARDSALGKRLHFGKGEREVIAEVVGVVASMKNRGLDRLAAPEIFAPLNQLGFANQLMTVVRTTGDPIGLAPSVREAVKQLDPLQPIYQVQTVDQAFASRGIQRRIATAALLIFASFALFLAAAGVYSVASYAAAARTREIGVRMAIGATGRDVRHLVARQALAPVAVGAFLGLIGAIGAGKGMGPILFEIQGYDPATLAVSMILLAMVALMAADGPARRASRTDLVAALGAD